MQADLGGRVLSYERRGSGDPLLLIMGMAGHAGLWREDFLAGLAEDFDVVAYDHRGIGGSTDVDGPVSIGELAEDAVALLDALGWDSAHVFGISMGGMVAQELVLTHERRVRRLVLGCTYCGGPTDEPDGTGPDADDGRDELGRSRPVAAGGLPGQPLGRVDRRRGALGTVPGPGARRPGAGAGGAAPGPGRVRPRQLDAPARREHADAGRRGTADEMVLYPNNEVIAALIPGAELLALPDVGHLFWWERPDEVLEAIRKHLSG